MDSTEIWPLGRVFAKEGLHILFCDPFRVYHIVRLTCAIFALTARMIGIHKIVNVHKGNTNLPIAYNDKELIAH